MLSRIQNDQGLLNPVPAAGSEEAWITAVVGEICRDGRWGPKIIAGIDDHCPGRVQRVAGISSYQSANTRRIDP
jgi:hypothetical protein